MSEETVYDDIKASMKELEEKPLDEPLDGAPAKEEPVEKVEKDEPVEKVEKDEPVEKVEKEDPLLTQDKAPSGWAPKLRERWGEVPKEFRDEIVRREADAAKGVRQIQEEVAPMREFVGGLMPFIQEAVNNAQNPVEYIGRTMAAERNLRNPDVNVKFNTLLEIADQYGIPLREVINASVGQEVLTKQQPQGGTDPVLQKRLDEQERRLAEFESRSRVNVIDQFKADKEFFDDVSADMAIFAEAILKQEPNIDQLTLLQKAYDKACRANDQVWEVISERKRTGGKKKDLQDKQKAAADVSVTDDGGIDVKVPNKKAFSEESSIHDDIRAAFEEASGRI